MNSYNQRIFCGKDNYPQPHTISASNDCDKKTITHPSKEDCLHVSPTKSLLESTIIIAGKEGGKAGEAADINGVLSQSLGVNIPPRRDESLAKTDKQHYCLKQDPIQRVTYSLITTVQSV